MTNGEASPRSPIQLRIDSRHALQTWSFVIRSPMAAFQVVPIGAVQLPDTLALTHDNPPFAPARKDLEFRVPIRFGVVDPAQKQNHA